MSEMMNALVLTEYKKLVYRQVPKPAIQANEVLIRVKACGICGSDIHGYDGSTGRRQPPVIMGHEASGVIEAIGASVEGWAVGDRVTFDSTIYCNRCSYCMHGAVNLCGSRRVLGVSCDDYRQDGAFAEYIAVPAHILYKLPDNVTFAQASLVEPLSVALHAVNLCPRELNASATVIGAGKIGLLIVQALRAAGYGKILVVDRNAFHRELALQMGADQAFDFEPDAVQAIRSETDGEGTDIVLEVVGVDEAFDLALKSARKGGTIVLVGNITPIVNFPMQWVVTRQLTLRGSCASAGEYPACLDMIARGTIRLDKIISATAPLKDGDAWFKRLYASDGDYVKVVLNP